MAPTTVSATAFLGAILPVPVGKTLLIAVQAGPAPRTHALAVKGVASRPVLALAIHLAISAPFTQRALEVAQWSAISRFTFADIRGDTSTVEAILGTNGNATVAVRGFRVAFAAFLYGFLLHQFLFLINRSVDNFVLGTSRWETEAPRVLSHGVRFLLGHLHRYRVRFLPGAYVGSFESRRRPRQNNHNGDRSQPTDREPHSRSIHDFELGDRNPATAYRRLIALSRLPFLRVRCG